MADAVISAPAVQATPAGYQVPAAQEITVKTVRAVIDGSGAGSAFLPTLQLIAPSGQVVWESPTDSTVAAGGSADVSWFPGLRRFQIVQFPNSTFGTGVIGGSPFAYYPLDETTLATVFDQSGNGHNLTQHSGAPHLNVRGLVPTSSDGALQIPAGTTATPCVECAFGPATLSPSALTVMAWIQVTSSDAINEIVTFGNGLPTNVQQFQFRLVAGVLHLVMFNAAGTVFDAGGVADLRDGSNHWVVGTYDGANITVYTDNVQVGQTAAVFTINGMAGQIGVGGSGFGLSAQTIDGTIDEVAIYTRALSASELSALYAKATTV